MPPEDDTQHTSPSDEDALAVAAFPVDRAAMTVTIMGEQIEIPEGRSAALVLASWIVDEAILRLQRELRNFQKAGAGKGQLITLVSSRARGIVRQVVDDAVEVQRAAKRAAEAGR